MPVNVFIGYKDENDKHHGYWGALRKNEYRLLKSLSEKFNSPDIELLVDGIQVTLRQGSNPKAVLSLCSSSSSIFCTLFTVPPLFIY